MFEALPLIPIIRVYSNPQYPYEFPSTVFGIWIIILSFCVNSIHHYFSILVNLNPQHLCAFDLQDASVLCSNLLSHAITSVLILFLNKKEKRRGPTEVGFCSRVKKSSHLQRLHEYERQHDFVKDLTEVIFPKHPKSLLSNVLFFLISRQRAAACFICCISLWLSL